MTTPEEWAKVARENTVSRAGLERAIADVVRRAVREARTEEREACGRQIDEMAAYYDGIEGGGGAEASAVCADLARLLRRQPAPDGAPR